MKGKEPLPKASTLFADEEDLQPQADWNSGRPGSRLGEFLVASRILLILYDTDVPYLGDIEDRVKAREDFLWCRFQDVRRTRSGTLFGGLVEVLSWPKRLSRCRPTERRIEILTTDIQTNIESPPIVDLTEISCIATHPIARRPEIVSSLAYVLIVLGPRIVFRLFPTVWRC